jgi:hypothetical protein
MARNFVDEEPNLTVTTSVGTRHKTIILSLQRGRKCLASGNLETIGKSEQL